MKTEHRRAVGYVRVSDESQVDSHSLEAQKTEIGRWCERDDAELVGFYVDEGVSAYKDNIDHRRGLVSLLNDAAQGKFDLVVVHTLDRWARNVGVQREALRRLGEAKVGFASVTEGFDYSTPAGKMVLTNIGSASEFFSGMLGIHVEKAQRHRAEQGLVVGPVPFGYTRPEPGGVPQVVAEEAEAVQEVFRRRAAGESTGEIASWLNDRGFKTTKGRMFTAHAVKDLLNCRVYLGVVPYKGAEYPGQHEAIITEALFRQVQARRRRRIFQRQVNGPRSPFQGLSSCIHCANPIQSDRHRFGAPMLRERHSFECATNGKSVVTRVLEDQLGLVLASLRLEPEWREKMAQLAVAERGGPTPAELEEKRRRLARAYADGGYTDGEYERLQARIAAQIREATVVELPTLEEAVALFGDLSQIWREATSEERRRLVAPLVERFYIDLEAKRIEALTPSPAFRWLLQGALKRSPRANVLLVSPEELARGKVWTWWRRGRPHLLYLHRPIRICGRRPEASAYAILWEAA